MLPEREDFLPGLFPDKESASCVRPNKCVPLNAFLAWRVGVVVFGRAVGPATSLRFPVCCRFAGKRVVFISSRVHPGEVPSSFVFDGVIDTLTREDDPRAKALLDLFVFKLVPMLNPDGVARGHYRADQLGVNLNRCYISPDPAREPTVFAAKVQTRTHTAVRRGVVLTSTPYPPPPHIGPAQSVVVSYHEQGLLHMYLDLHAHATKRGCFLYGNHLPDLERQVWNVLYARLVSLHSPYLEFGACNFSEKNMKMKDKRDKVCHTCY